MSKKKFWKITNSVDSSGSVLYLEGHIASESWWGDEVTPQAFRDELKKITSNKLTVIINSLGGDVWAGVSIHDALKELEAEVTVKVSGVAASIASVIAMAGDKIQMTTGSTMMIHRASMITWGDAGEHQKAIEMLETVEEGIVNIYADRTNKSREEIASMMADETWMSAEKAVELGFADEVVTTKQEEAEGLQNAFSGNFAFSMSATKESLQNFVEKVKNSEDVETDVDENPDETETDTEVKTDEDNGEVEVAEPTDPEVANSARKNLTEMTEEEKKAIAKSQVMTPENQARPEDKAPVDYLKSKKSVEDFADVLKNNAGKSPADVKEAWKKVAVQNGITNPDILALPEPLVSEIRDAMEASQIFNLLNHTGMDSYKVLLDSSDLNADTSRAGQHNPDWEDNESNVDKTKDQQELTFVDRTLEADYIYKYLVLDKKTVRANRGSGALIRFVMRELPARIIREMERAAMISDGRANNDKRKITSFIAVKADVVANNTFATSYTPEAGESRYEAVAHAKDLLKTAGSVYLVAKKGYATAARFEKDDEGRLLFPIGTRAQDIFEVEGIIEPDWFTDATDPDYDAYLVVFNSYLTVGDDSIESFTNFKLETNENEYLQEIYKGGGLAGFKAAVGIAAGS